MKCPKCGYLGFEHVERCRNCGYEFSLATPAVRSDLSLRNSAADADLTLGDLDLVPHATEVAAVPPTGGELPLFPRTVPDETRHLRPAAPRPPLSVRRPTPDTRKARHDPPAAPKLDLAPPAVVAPPAPTASMPVAKPAPSAAVPARPRAARAVVAAPSYVASLGSRVCAAAIDVAVLAAIDIVVVYFTLQICGLSVADIAILPKAPLLAFLAAQNGAYLVAFTAGGQTLGKMALGIRVVSADNDNPLRIGQAALRALVWTLLAAPAGLGVLTTLGDKDLRGWHDRSAGTRVVHTSTT